MKENNGLGISRDKLAILYGLRKLNLRREIGFLVIAARINSSRANYFKAKIDKHQQNNK